MTKSCDFPSGPFKTKSTNFKPDFSPHFLIAVDDQCNLVWILPAFFRNLNSSYCLKIISDDLKLFIMILNLSCSVSPKYTWPLKLRCDSRFQGAFTTCSCVFKVITLVWANQRNYLENATTCSKRIRKTLVATQLKTFKSNKTRCQIAYY